MRADCTSRTTTIETVRAVASRRKMATTTLTRILDAAVWIVRRHECAAVAGSVVVVVGVVARPAPVVAFSVAAVPVVVLVVVVVPVAIAVVPVVVFVIAAVVFVLAVVLVLVVLVEVGTRQRNSYGRCLRREWDRGRDYR
jgi:peptidoglycan/LPS O-acetylase OafA/YrhL